MSPGPGKVDSLRALRHPPPRRGPLVLALVLLVACSENFGPPPPDSSRELPVRAEAFAGPVPARTALALAIGGGRVHLGTDRGLYQIDGRPLDGRFRPGHAGFTDADGRESMGAVDRLAVDASGRNLVLVSRFGGGDFLTASSDGGETFASLPLPSPNPLLELVDALHALPPGPADPAGAFLVAQGATLFRWAVHEGLWREVELPAGPVAFGPAQAGGDGSVVLAAETGEGWRLLASADGGRSFEETGEGFDGPALAVAVQGGLPSVITVDGWWRGGELRIWEDHDLLAARLAVDEQGLRYAILGESRTTGDLALAVGVGLPDRLDGFALSTPLVEETLVSIPGGAVMAAPDGALHVFDGGGEIGRRSFAGGELDWGSIAVHDGNQLLHLGHRRTGEVFRGPAHDPDAMLPRGTPLFQSESRSLLVDSQLGDAIFAGSFGVHYNDGVSVVWEQRNAGQFSYLLENFSGPVKPQALAIAPSGELWLGAIEGDGPYRSDDGGQSWIPVHDGLGPPGSRLGEDGLPFATTIRAFAFLESEVWMASFRGGVWRLDDEDVWTPENWGLPDLAGATVDSCCFDTEVREIDARDLVITSEGTLLTITPWGAFRRERGDDSWRDSSLGLANSDLRGLDADPEDPSRVVAVARGSVETPAWLFLSQDGGRSWITVDSFLVAKRGRDVVWSRSRRDEIVALLENQGAWRVELDP